MSEKPVPDQGQNLPAFPLNISRLPRKGHRQMLDASKQELKEIAANSNVNRIFRLKADLAVKPWHKDGVCVEGAIIADYQQSCIVTLEAMQQSLDFTFVSKYVHSDSKLWRLDQTATGEIAVDYDGEEVPELLESDVIDLWEVVLEFFNLEVDPYPRLDGASLEDDDHQVPVHSKTSPFAILKSLK